MLIKQLLIHRAMYCLPLLQHGQIKPKKKVIIETFYFLQWPLGSPGVRGTVGTSSWCGCVSLGQGRVVTFWPSLSFWH